MNPFAAAVQLLGNLAGLGQQFAPLVNDPSIRNGEYAAATATSMGGDATAIGVLGVDIRSQRALRALARAEKINALRAYWGRVWDQHPEWASYRSKKEWVEKTTRNEIRERNEELKKQGKDARSSAKSDGAKAASIIAYTMAVVDALELLTGVGPPDEGEALEAGSRQFTALGEQLRTALADGGWQGGASQAYADRDAALQDLVLLLAELDGALAGLVGDQADWVTHARLGFGILKDLLAVALVIELALRLSSAGAFSAMDFAIAVCVLGIGAALAILSALTYCAVAHSKQADVLTGQYREAVAALRGASASIQMGTAAQSRIASWWAISSGVPAASSTAEVPVLAGVASGSQGYHASVSVAVGEGKAPPDAMAARAQTLEDTAASVPMMTMPSLAPMTTPSGRGGGLSGRAPLTSASSQPLSQRGPAEQLR